MKVIVGTKNQKKVAAVKAVFLEILKQDSVEIDAHDAQSLVPDAPHDEDTYRGAFNRARECAEKFEADYFVGIESGLVERYGNYFEEAWAVVISTDGDSCIGYSSGLLLPRIVVDRMRKGEKHNKIMEHFDKVFDLPEDNRDTWSRYTGGNMTRELSLQEALRNAVVQIAPSDRNLYRA